MANKDHTVPVKVWSISLVHKTNRTVRVAQVLGESRESAIDNANSLFPNWIAK